MTYVIEKNVQMPKKAAKFPLDLMQIGDSFGLNSASELGSLRNAIYQFRRGKKEKFRISTKALRVWRIE
jgi:hypothetical protein